VSSGRIGRPLSARIVSQTSGFGPEVPVAHDLFNKLSSGANLLTINGGHTLDLVEAVLGPIGEVEARIEIRWPIVKLAETAEESARETADYVWVVGTTQSGAEFTADIEAGVQPENVRFGFEVRGSDGWLRLTSDHPYGFQAGELMLMSSVAFAPAEGPVVFGGLMGAAINVGEVYASLARDLQAATYSTPGFEHALHNARLIDAVTRAAERGKRLKIPD
jgi:predicted dehydrogenase